MPARAVRRTRLAAAAVAVALAALVAGPRASAAPDWPDHAAVVPVQYKVEAELVTRADEDFPRQIRGRQSVIWTNLGRERVESVYIHLYANAFRDGRSAFLRERARDGGELPDPFVPGGCDVEKLTVVGPTDRQLITEFVPCADAPDDQTVLRARLPQPVEPKESVVLRMEFTTLLPRPVARMGAVRDFVMAGQWFPKLGRYVGGEPADPRLLDGWYCHHYHATTEFAADFADYEVTLKVPAGWTVGATGQPVGEEARDETAGTVTRTWQARSVVDFAWTASPRFVPKAVVVDPDAPPRTVRDTRVADHVRAVRGVLGVSPAEADLPPVEVLLLLQPEHADQAERHFEAARATLALYGTWLGPYTYPRLTIVDPPHGVPVGGMEYPTLVTAGTSIGSPAAALRPEHVTVHEIGHQWFMNLLASNEADEAWLDEGLNSWFTARAMEIAWERPASQLTTVLGIHFQTELPIPFAGVAAGLAEPLGLPAWLRPPELAGFRLWRDGPALLSTTGSRSRQRSASDPPGFPRQGPVLAARRRYVAVAGWDGMVQPGWEYVSRESYGGNAYARAMLVLESLDRHVRRRYEEVGGGREGERRMLTAFREYASRWRFRHPTTADLLQVLREETGWPELPQLFDTLARTSGFLDYAVEGVRVVEPDPDAPRTPGTPLPDAESEFVVVRRGEVVVPVTVRVEVHGAEQPVVLAWDGAGRWHRFRVPGRVRAIAVDPEQLFPQDATLSDNFWSDRANPRPGLKWGTHALLWLENALAGYGRFF